MSPASVPSPSPSNSSFLLKQELAARKLANRTLGGRQGVFDHDHDGDDDNGDGDDDDDDDTDDDGDDFVGKADVDDEDRYLGVISRPSH